MIKCRRCKWRPSILARVKSTATAHRGCPTTTRRRPRCRVPNWRSSRRMFPPGPLPRRCPIPAPTSTSNSRRRRWRRTFPRQPCPSWTPSRLHLTHPAGWLESESITRVSRDTEDSWHSALLPSTSATTCSLTTKNAPRRNWRLKILPYSPSSPSFFLFYWILPVQLGNGGTRQLADN